VQQGSWHHIRKILAEPTGMLVGQFSKALYYIKAYDVLFAAKLSYYGVKLEFKVCLTLPYPL
jgi:hypothetical protein